MWSNMAQIEIRIHNLPSDLQPGGYFGAVGASTEKTNNVFEIWNFF